MDKKGNIMARWLRGHGKEISRGRFVTPLEQLTSCTITEYTGGHLLGKTENWILGSSK